MRILIVYNPTAGDDGDDDVRETVARFEQAKHQVTTQSVKEEDWQRALRCRFELVVAAGGDGTVAQVFKQLAGSSLPVAIVPIGSANNIAHSIEPTHAEQTRFDVSSLSWDGGATTFVESCGGGVFAEMIARSERAAEDPSGDDKVALGLRSLLEIATDAAPRSWRVEADGRDLSGDYVAVDVMNIAFAGPNIPVAPAADPGDGLLDLVLVRAGDAAALAAQARARLEHSPESELRLETYRARKVVLEPPPRAPMRVDDDLLDSFSGALTTTVTTTVDVRRPPS